MILVLAGTLEGRKVIKFLLKKGFPLIATVTTDYGAQLLQKEGAEEVVVGKLDQTQLTNLIKEKGIKALIDATHPFALEISKNALEVSSELGVSYLRFERKETPLPNDKLIVPVYSLSEALDKAIEIGGTIFSTLGSKNLPYMVQGFGTNFVARVLPTPEVISSCFKLGLAPENLVALKGPFTKNLNKELFLQFGAEVVITKDTGIEGGLREKITAALELGIPCIVWRRPKINYPEITHCLEKTLQFAHKNLKNI